MNVIFTCGGTGGHINPAIAVANLIKERNPGCNILFIGAKGHMEEQLVPKAGYRLECLPGSGLSRGKSLAALKKNINAVKCVFDAVSQCKKIIKDFKPDVILGTGGYAAHGPYEHITKEGLDASAKVIETIIRLWAEK